MLHLLKRVFHRLPCWGHCASRLSATEQATQAWNECNPLAIDEAVLQPALIHQHNVATTPGSTQGAAWLIRTIYPHPARLLRKSLAQLRKIFL
ncbi:hypothetical protein O3W44_03390 [Pantoea sp. LMR881]|uniref:hypothetical protein n=1 Tax=Pantoea sp. LMR881 TaxID=3014336 RepID=UPI0022AF6A1C|nr:hypothetical protein [Pantoea sp. LMR881]MCZ4058334.1 hypothetical protein [Pantoea sp. LMR881]